MAQQKPQKSRSRRRVKNNIAYGQAHINTTYNNTIDTLTHTDAALIA